MRLITFNFKRSILLLSTLLLLGCAENLEQFDGTYDTEKGTTNSNQQSSIDETSISEEKRELSYEEIILEEINFRDDLEIVENEAVCEEEEVYCLYYDSNTTVEIKLDNTQKEFYDLMIDYKLPASGIVEIESTGHPYEIVKYENGFQFYTRNKMLHLAPYNSTNMDKPTEEQYFGIVIYWVQLYGKNSPEEMENKKQAQVTLKGLNNIKEFAQDEIVLTWVEDCSTILQQIVDEDNPSKEMYQEALKQLNYLGDVVSTYRYHRGTP